MHANLFIKILKQFAFFVIPTAIVFSILYFYQKFHTSRALDGGDQININLSWLSQLKVANKDAFHLEKLSIGRLPSAAASKDDKSSTSWQCLNSRQGRKYIVDERGFVCTRAQVLSNGCCNLTTSSASLEAASVDLVRQFVCDSCHQEYHCCSEFEHCISCCVNPDRKAIWEKVANQALASKDRLLLTSTGVFEFCLRKCRTSSQSVQHENSYRNPRLKYCFGPGQSPVVGPQSFN